MPDPDADVVMTELWHPRAAPDLYRRHPGALSLRPERAGPRSGNADVIVRLGRPCRAAAVAAGAAIALTALALPAAALIARLTTLPLGRGEATIEWTGRTGDNPTVNGVTGRVGGLEVHASDQLPRYQQPSSSAPTTIPAYFPLGNVTGSIDGAPFTLHITLSLKGLTQSPSALPVGAVTGSFRNQPIRAKLLGNTHNQNLDFAGTIGSDHVTGSITGVTRHGSRSVAHASFDVTG